MVLAVAVALWAGRAAADPGALVRITTRARVGVLLDEIPPAMRDRVAAALLAAPPAFWEARARMQLETTTYRLVYRSFYYPARTGRRQLPLPPAEAWTVTTEPPKRARLQGHDMVLAPYRLETVLLSDPASPALSEPKLRRAGGSWHEKFQLPADPELLLQRTGFACMDEAEFPPNSVDEENARAFFDDQCTVEKPGALSCHLTPPLPKESCRKALKRHVGRVPVALRFTRLRWDPAVADRYRVGEVTAPTGDLAVVREGLFDHRLEYRYIPADSCAVAEGCVKGTGWRRLLKFTASVRNTGGAAVHIGAVDFFLEGLNPANEQHNIFEFSACHGHYHFSHYGDFLFAGTTGDKRAFCLQTTQRYSNNESTSLVSPYADCNYQGISAGWGDDYIAGIECQWIDVTDVDTSAGPQTAMLSFDANPDQFLCEGRPILDEHGNPAFVPTEFVTADGKPVDRFACDFDPAWQANNYAEVPATLPRVGAQVTGACTRGQLGPRRDCGFTAGPSIACTAGQPATLRCTLPAGAAPQVVRACETSAVLGTGVDCAYRQALANVLVEGEATAAVACPAARDADEPGGQVALYAAPVWDGDALAPPSCTLE
ncbi:MAG: hypothetical protein KIT14_16715 [bacterium]|nr:hypothetical protein [bacterium]